MNKGLVIKAGVAGAFFFGILCLTAANARAGEKVLQTITDSSSRSFSLFGIGSDTISISGAPATAKVSGIVLSIEGTCDYGGYLTFTLEDASSAHQYPIDTSEWYDTGILDETVSISGLNDLPVNQSWKLVGASGSGESGDAVTSWQITITYDDGQVLGPDLVVQISNCAPPSVTVGAALSLSATVKNQGNQPAAASIATWYIATHTPPTQTDPVLASTSVPALNAAATSGSAQPVYAPTAPGDYYIALMADSGQVVQEQNEGNNWGPVFTLAVHPRNVLIVDPASWVEEGMNVTMTAPPGVTYQWKKGGNPISDEPPGLTGTNSRVLKFTPALQTDTGVYTCAYDDGTKALFETPSYSLHVYPPNSLPVAGPAALALLAAIMAGIGSARARRRKDEG